MENAVNVSADRHDVSEGEGSFDRRRQLTWIRVRQTKVAERLLNPVYH